MDHSHHGGGISTADGVPDNFYMQRMYWAVVGAAVVFATVVNVLNKILAWERYHISQKAKPKSIFWTLFATSTAIGRELCYASLGNLRYGTFSFRFPTLGRTSIVLSNVVVVLVLCFYKLDTLDAWSWEDIGYRTGFISIAQLPLIVLLAGKFNVIGWLTGLGYERLNWLHRWTARTLWLSATVHMSFWFRNWARYDYIKVKLMKDPLTQRGFAAWCILTFVVVTSVAPARRISYEVFVISHLITFAGFMAAVWLHAPDEVKIWVWLPIAFFAVERLLKAKRLLFLNLTLFQFKKRRASGLWANSASFRPLPGGVTKITVETPAFTWSPGQHVLLSCHSILPLQSHPFTIASLPSDGRLEFFVKAHRGGTKSFLNHASTNATLPISTPNNRSITRKVAIEGPFGRMRSLEQFDSIIFFAGSTGATFILPHMRHIVALWRYWESRRVDSLLWKPKEALTRRIRFVWVVKSRDHIEWFKTQLQQVIDDTTVHRAIDKRLDRKVDISTYITCDEELVAEKNDPGNCCQQSSHGEAQQTDITSSERPTLAKKDMGDTEVTSVGSSQQTAREDRGCAPDGSCCCKATVEDESNAPTCTCSRPVKSADVDVSPIKPESKMEIYPAITQNPPMKVLSGRPQPRSIIRKVLEEAEGESAVVVCGPPELRDSVRASVVALSDERAVHKGTGAQGIYLHIEGFDY